MQFASVALFPADAQVAAPPKPSAPSKSERDAEYQKLDEVRTFIRNRNAVAYAVTGANAIDESAYIPIGGIEQWVTIQGTDRNNPVLLIVHGGPGDATTLKHLHKAKIILLGHSFGSALAYLSQRPGRTSYMRTSALAHDAQAVADLKAVGPRLLRMARGGSYSTNGATFVRERAPTGFSSERWELH